MIKMLKREEEKKLVIAAQAGDIEAQQRLVLNFMPLVKKWARGHPFYEDAVQQGVLGLYHALKNYRLNKEVSFGVFAKYWVRDYEGRREILPLEKIEKIHENLTCHRKISDLPMNLLDFPIKFDEFLQTCSTRDQDILIMYYIKGKSDTEIASQLGLCRQRIHQLRRSIINRIIKIDDISSKPISV